MPLVNDVDEAVLINGMFIELLQAKNHLLMSTDNLELTKKVVQKLKAIVQNDPNTGLMKEKHIKILA